MMMSGSHTDQQQLANAGGSYIVTPINGVIQIPLSSAHHDVISATIEEIRRVSEVYTDRYNRVNVKGLR